MFWFSKKVFASYSEKDRDIIFPVVNLLRVARGWIFYAPDSIAPRTLWEREIEKAVRKCKLMVVFWCAHSKESEWVNHEYRLAIRLGKVLVPVLLDNTSLPGELHRYQGIDFREAVGNHEKARGEIPSGFRDAASFSVDLDKNFNVGIPKRSIRRYDMNRSTWVLLFGALLAALAILRPFPAIIDSEAITAFNGMVGILGAFLTYKGWRMLRRSKTFISIDEARKELAVALSLLCREQGTVPD